MSYDPGSPTARTVRPSSIQPRYVYSCPSCRCGSFDGERWRMMAQRSALYKYGLAPSACWSWPGCRAP
jgi:hypothetical protein